MTNKPDMQYILIVEDNLGLNKGLCTALKSEKCSVISCSCLKDAREQMMLFAPALVLLDENLPDGNGLELLKEIKNTDSSIKVIMLTANDTDSDIVQGLECGADDYITKPFSLAVLRARVNTQLKSVLDKAEQNSEVYAKNEYDFDFLKMTFKVKGELVELSKTEQKLLYIFVKNEDIVVKRNDLIDKVWIDGSEYVDENALSVAVKRLRTKLSAQKYIKTVYGLGYKWSMDDGEGSK